MSPKAPMTSAERANPPAASININKQERQLSLAMGLALVGLGLGSGFKLRGLLMAAVGGAMAYRGATGHCHVYEALGIDSTQPSLDPSLDDDEREPAATQDKAPSRGDASRSGPFEYAEKNQVDKDRFDKLKATQVDRGREEETAIEIAAEEVKELRRREGRSKDEERVRLEELDETWEKK
jgi:hypothetical protein